MIAAVLYLFFRIHTHTNHLGSIHRKKHGGAMVCTVCVCKCARGTAKNGENIYIVCKNFIKCKNWYNYYMLNKKRKEKSEKNLPNLRKINRFLNFEFWMTQKSSSGGYCTCCSVDKFWNKPKNKNVNIVQTALFGYCIRSFIETIHPERLQLQKYTSF